MTANEKWNKIVVLHEQFFNSSESKVQDVWEDIFVEILRYNRLDGEVERHRNIQLGSTERVIPDIIVKNQEHDLFIVELKQHNMPFHPIMERQLFSYLKQLKANIAVLVCEKLYIYCYDYAKSDDEQLKWEIPFTENNNDGIKFVEHFSRDSFHKEEIRSLLSEKRTFMLNVEEIVNRISSEMVLEALKENLQTCYSSEEIDKALMQISVSVTREKPSMSSRESRSSYTTSCVDVSSQPTKKMKKSEAMKLFRQIGAEISKPCLYASLIKSGDRYWANPSVEFLHFDWQIILNDTKKNVLYLFMIPKNTFHELQFSMRSDKDKIIDLNILYRDDSFIDKKSKIDFLPYLTKQLSYKS